MNNDNNIARRICLTGMLAALYLALNMVGFRAWSFHITFASLPVVVGGLLFGPLEGMLIAAIGEFFNQTLSYGVTPTTVLWIIPPVVRGLMIGYAACVAALAGLFVVLIQPVFTFPEWVPAVLVEPKDIAAAFWNVWQDTATVMELRTPELLRARFYSRLMGWACGFGALALGCLWGGVRQELNRLPLLQEKPVRPDKKDS